MPASPPTASQPQASISEPTPLRVLVVDDEEPARWRIGQLVADCVAPRAEVVGEVVNAAQARVWLAERQCDVVLLDIALPGSSGLMLAEELRQLMAPGSAPDIVFVTAHGEHALRAFELAATDYLTKPVRRERLQAALQRVADRLKLAASRPVVAEERLAATEVGEAVLVATDRGRVLRVPLAEVMYFKAELKYVTVRTAQRSLVLDESLSELEERLGKQFLRVHRNALVARRAVRALERRWIAGEGGGEGSEEGGETWAVRIAEVDEWLAVSRRQLPMVREALVALAQGPGGPPV